ncbi:hypothetical protein [Picosynechococcus sp. PCC 8807]|uniref:hypothetical protein n=1 Tax=Picosynechococcus sp. PCC 8807 TaxID=195248 RepID=UPI000810DF1E|nr:hypothetical protein [Picosynechococcus sp. PCC 8807]ANV89538.1 hypothetical protein AWQ24_02170 [Picosynechococcus sp. PCC 8807]
MKNNFNIIDDLPRYLTIEDYQSTKQQFEKICKQSGLSKDQFAYFGSVSCPQVSDIDALVVGSEQQIRLIHKLFLDEQKKNKVFNDIFWHPPVYLLDSPSNSSIYLHTLENLDRTITINSKPVNQHNPYSSGLYFTWITFLLSIIGSVTCKKNIPLRLLLLLYKNIEVSEMYLGRKNKFISTKKINISSDYIRKLALEDYKSNQDAILKAFISKIRGLMFSFDLYCNFIEKKNNKYDTPKFSFINKKNLALTSKKTSINQFGKLILTNLNPVAMTALLYWKKYPDIPKEYEYFEYIKISKETINLYKEKGFYYNFVTPFGIKS